jgi:hypothetical protein
LLDCAISRGDVGERDGRRVVALGRTPVRPANAQRRRPACATANQQHDGEHACCKRDRGHVGRQEQQGALAGLGINADGGSVGRQAVDENGRFRVARWIRGPVLHRRRLGSRQVEAGHGVVDVVDHRGLDPAGGGERFQGAEGKLISRCRRGGRDQSRDNEAADGDQGRDDAREESGSGGTLIHRILTPQAPAQWSRWRRVDSIAAVEPIGDSPDADEAADRAVDQTALLDGEDPGSKYPEDVLHWINAYSELIEFKEGLINKSRSEIADMENPNARKEADDVDVTILVAELDRYQKRLRFWKQRREDLHHNGA